MYVLRCTGVCLDQNRTVRDHNARGWDGRLQDLLPHPHLPCEPSWRFQLILGRYKTLSCRGPSAAPEASTYYWTIFPGGRSCHRAFAALSRPLWPSSLSRRMIESVRGREAAQAVPSRSRLRAQHLKQASDGSYRGSFSSKFVPHKGQRWRSRTVKSTRNNRNN